MKALEPAVRSEPAPELLPHAILPLGGATAGLRGRSVGGLQFHP
ncbi:MAG: hypothetical protein OXD46_02350 [Chloroflexi bacterium]|nr:hypothetical protein [Chloroflexota bacterium]